MYTDECKYKTIFNAEKNSKILNGKSEKIYLKR